MDSILRVCLIVAAQNLAMLTMWLVDVIKFLSVQVFGHSSTICYRGETIYLSSYELPRERQTYEEHEDVATADILK